jgi:hypothetical protein
MRAILYFNARGDAGLTRGFVATSAGLVFWVALGVLVTTWYDRKKLYRMPPELLEYVDQAVRGYTDQKRGSTEGVLPSRAQASRIGSETAES